MEKYLFFDLDGTLVDSQAGVINTFRHTFEMMDVPLPSAEILQSFVGPPLEETLAKYVNDIDKAVKIFRDYYAEMGVYQVTLFPEVDTILDQLKSQGYGLYITTSKHEPMAYKMLTHLGQADKFNGIYGSLPNASSKAQVLERALVDTKAPREASVIIGDTHFDMIGGKAVGIHRLGVLWGYGNQASLVKHGAEAISDHISDLIQDLHHIFDK